MEAVTLEALKIVGGIVFAVVGILIIILALMQDSKQPGTNALTGQTSDSYLSKNRGKTLEAKLVFFTKIGIGAFLVLAVALNLAITYLK